MTLTINQQCTGCHACYLVCPNKAIYKTGESSPKFAIHQKRCNDCIGQFEHSQCVSICPIEEAITRDGIPANPAGSLTAC
ncbi:4Fe-4S dicluster domain-containing protein [Vibrio hippocampi]|uniref:4Fe-4S ferredoxin-type domain-containing protein n=1 Tax=Vibrio hippocampi TaxID=654686 RepID=A0ABN8DMF0_9VIBR|nr:4Fe-4S dicluster domain-containing protein [Vibrio hippocampi]CAH0529331.1 hypothetical protein VHP8226_03166 [Vibrio hippocampi]